jgi:hypothetical protein
MLQNGMEGFFYDCEAASVNIFNDFQFLKNVFL